MADDRLPPWREITTDDYYPRGQRRNVGVQEWNRAYSAVQSLIEGQRKGEFRLRLVLRETHDLLPGVKRDPLRVIAYEFGPPAILLADEVVLITTDGQRHSVDRTNLPPQTIWPRGQKGGFTGLN